MKHTKLEFSPSFKVVLGTDQAQAAVMTLLPGQTTGGEDNVYASSEQWLFVVSREGEAVVAGTRQCLRLHSLIVIGTGEVHEIRNTGDAPLETLNFYIPPEY